MKRQILVAEDEVMLRVIAVEMLEDAGFEVFQAGGEPFVELDGINFPEAIFLDADHVAEISSGFDQNLELIVLGKFGEGALLDQMRDPGAGPAEYPPPSILAHKRRALVEIEQARTAEGFMASFSTSPRHSRPPALLG